MNTWNTLPESYQPRVYSKVLTTVKQQIDEAENPAPAVVISVESARVDNTILLDYWASDVSLEEPEIGSTEQNLLTDNNYTVDEPHCGMPGAGRQYEDEGDERVMRDAIPTASRRRQPATELESFDMETSDVNRYEGEIDDNADADAEEAASEANDGSTQTVED
jgi:hypothetical protein